VFSKLEATAKQFLKLNFSFIHLIVERILKSVLWLWAV
jgi:hypothetical protein